MSLHEAWLSRLRARGRRFVSERRGVSALDALDRGGARVAITARDGSFSYAEAAFRARLLALSLRSRGFGTGWVALWRGGRRRDWLPVMAAVGAAGGVWSESSAPGRPGGAAVVFSDGGCPSEGAGSGAGSLWVDLDAVDPAATTLGQLLSEGKVLAGLGGLRRHWKTQHVVNGEPRVQWGPGAFVTVAPPGELGRHRVGDLTSDFVAARLAHAHLLFGATLVLDGDSDPDQLVAYGTPRTGLVTWAPTRELVQSPGSVGRPFPDVDLWVVGEDGTVLGANEVGDIWVGNPGVLSPPGVPDGVAPTGDRGAVDDAGFLHLA